MTSSVEDMTVTISATKAKELKLKNDDVVLVVGRRRRAMYARVHTVATSKKKSVVGQATISENLASQLRVRRADSIKIVSLQHAADNDDQVFSGDLTLLQVSAPPAVAGISLQPIEDSVRALASSEGGDELSDDDIMARFVTPYFSGASLVKQGQLISIRDENNKKMDFYISHVDLQQEEKQKDTKGTYANLWLMLRGNCSLA
jgi:hypothetical protein